MSDRITIVLSVSAFLLILLPNTICELIMLCIDAASDQPLWASFVVLALHSPRDFSVVRLPSSPVANDIVPPITKNDEVKVEEKVDTEKGQRGKERKVVEKRNPKRRRSVLAPATVTDDTTTATNTCYAAVLTTFPSASPTIAATDSTLGNRLSGDRLSGLRLSGIRLSAFDSRQSTLGIRLSAFDSQRSTLWHSTLGIRLSAIDTRQSTLGNQLPASVFGSQHPSIQ
ncbi:hypothetical protein BDB00DRAFT_940082 [Zychaea mexicana]|uniref:uncharacterized protein n=1 Tax=Zychaea mexicana TaxID=64656 RepID=UPI0022FDC747|nr:uncharacterized protein BDB00DRAFT_940082 [Zychaea mexicana]KAI9491784.1 hypothetical protein BDB00DRAFT_940082 [Zychaea mexicana]